VEVVGLKLCTAGLISFASMRFNHSEQSSKHSLAVPDFIFTWLCWLFFLIIIKTSIESSNQIVGSFYLDIGLSYYSIAY